VQLCMSICPINNTNFFYAKDNHTKRHEWFDITMEIGPRNGKFCLQSLGLWSFIIVFYRRIMFWHSTKIEDHDILHSCEKFYIFLPSICCALYGKRQNFSHSWKIFVILNIDSCENLLVFSWVKHSITRIKVS
jgi:hypothetical protein